jgi:anti-sigma factor RsiW
MPPIGEQDLHAFIDGELDPARRAAVQEAMAHDPAMAGRIAAFRADKQRLAALYGPVAERPLPAAWLRSIEAASRPRPWRRVAARWRSLAAAAVLLAAIGATAALLAPSRDTILAEAAAAHDGTLRTRQILAGAALPPASVGNRLLQATLGLPVRTPDLTRFGFRLAAIDVFQPPTRPAVGLVYRDAGQRELTIYLRRSAGEARFDLLRRGRLRVCIWQDDVLGAVMTADMTAGEMMRVASRAYVELNL